ncbi:M16 family metallopeptidase [Shewanella algae]|uniref:M16 family metallopeptidase n=1 Tax=Shewanella algae TaxID=38313 RepID=UPI00235A1D74|nr:insulinase family protein [Shewanella algae]MDC8853471.1 insulinase family protein [Shewanella algae]
MIVKTRFGCLMMAAMACLLAACQTSEMLPLNSDPDLVQGRLDNGFRYYLAPNDAPAKRVYLRLVVNAGSMHEDDDQRGVAHMVEHMAFNGSKHFKGNSVISALEDAGLKFGIDVNAFTDFENTVYLLNLPDNRPQTLELALRIIADWAAEVSIARDDLDAERGIVLEEWRARLGPMLRLGDKKSAIEMAGSRYATRDPIGDPETIRQVSGKRVADFYRRWYRPDNMALVASGDIDVAKFKSMVEQYLGAMPAATTPLETVDFGIPLQDGLRAAKVHEVGAEEPALELSFFSPLEPDYSRAGYRRELAEQIAGRMLNLRLQQWEKQHQDWLLSGAFFSSAIGRETRQSIFTLQLKKGEYHSAASALFDLLATLKQHGFSDKAVASQLKRQLKLEQRRADKAVFSIDIAGDLVTTAANLDPWLSYKDRARLNLELIGSLTTEDINQALARLTAPSSRLLLQTLGTGEMSALTSAEANALWQQSMSRQHGDFEAGQQSTEMPEFKAEAGSSRFIGEAAEGRLKEYRLSNGLRLVFSQSDLNPGDVHFKALTVGGMGSLAPSEAQKLRLAVNLADEFGAGEVPQQAIINYDSDYPLVLSSLLDGQTQGFSGWAHSDDLAALLQLFRFKLQQVQFASNALKHWREEYQATRAQYANDPGEQFARTIDAKRYPRIPTVYNPDPELLTTLTEDELLADYRRHMLGNTDFILFFVGDIDEARLIRLAEQYLAGIEVKREARKQYQIRPATPKERLQMPVSGEPRAETEVYLTSYPQPWSAKQAYQLSLMGELIQEQLRLKLREEASGVYGVTAWFWQEPGEDFSSGRISFSSDPERVDELIQQLHLVLKRMADEGVSPHSLENKRRQRQDRLQRELKSNLGWLEAVSQSYMAVGGPQQIGQNIRFNEEVTAAELNNLLKQFILQSRVFEAVMLPASE